MPSSDYYSYLEKKVRAVQKIQLENLVPQHNLRHIGAFIHNVTKMHRQAV